MFGRDVLECRLWPLASIPPMQTTTLEAPITTARPPSSKTVNQRSPTESHSHLSWALGRMTDTWIDINTASELSNRTVMPAGGAAWSGRSCHG